jgi:hypothetical protein
MKAFWSLWDVETGNSLGTYDTEDDALAVVRALLVANGDGYAEALDLGRRSTRGEWEAVAGGSRLAELARAGSANRSA